MDLKKATELQEQMKKLKNRKSRLKLWGVYGILINIFLFF